MSPQKALSHDKLTFHGVDSIMNLAQAALPTFRFNVIRFPDLDSCTNISSSRVEWR